MMYTSVVAVPVRTNNNVAWQCAYHVVWCTKYRRKVVGDRVETRLKEIVAEVCAERDATIRAFEVMPDHCHLLVEVDPQYGIHRLVKQIKGRSSRLLRSEFPILKSRLPTLWTNAYFVATTGGAPLAAIQQYVESQKGK
jgi:putative transposase